MVSLQKSHFKIERTRLHPLYATKFACRAASKVEMSQHGAAGCDVSARSGDSWSGLRSPIGGGSVERIFLKLENIRGASSAGGLKAYVNAPAGSEQDLPQENVAGSAALFGLGSASKVDGQHGGNGITLIFDISDLARRLVDQGNFDPSNVRVKIVSAHSGGSADPITIERVSVLRE